jgi:hypothetical protein
MTCHASSSVRYRAASIAGPHVENGDAQVSQVGRPLMTGFDIPNDGMADRSVGELGSLQGLATEHRLS